MLFAVTCTDRANSLDLRLKHRPAHLEWATSDASPIKMAGPLLDANQQPVGSLLIIEAEDEASLRAILSADPYAQADLFGDVFWMPFRWTINAPDGLQ